MDPRLATVLDELRTDAEARVAAAYKRLDETRAGGTEGRTAHAAWEAAEADRQAVIRLGHKLRARLGERKAA
jgi:hypothetical protein